MSTENRIKSKGYQWKPSCQTHKEGTALYESSCGHRSNQFPLGHFLYLLTLPCSYILFSVFSKPNPVWFGKDTPKKCVGFSKPIPVWFGKKKIDFARHRFQTKFRLVWKILMTIVNVLKIPIRIQFGLEKSLTTLTEYSVEHRSVG